VVTLDGDTADAVRSLGDLIPFPQDRAQGRRNEEGPGTVVPMLCGSGGGPPHASVRLERQMPAFPLAAS
jgi:hypothetical protein